MRQRTTVCCHGLIPSAADAKCSESILQHYVQEEIGQTSAKILTTAIKYAQFYGIFLR